LAPVQTVWWLLSKVRLPVPKGTVYPLYFLTISRYDYYMNKIKLQQKALQASFMLHEQMLTDCNYAGYDGDKFAFDRLYCEVLVICRDVLPDDADLEQVVDTFHDFMFAQMNGDLDQDWYL